MANEESMENTSDYPEMDYFMNEEECDFVFIIDGQRVPVLKSLLSVKSKVFRAMFSGNYSETILKELELKDTNFDAFKAMIRYIYSEQLVLRRVGMEGEDYRLAVDVYKLGHKYELNRLMTRTLNKLKTMISTENIGFVYEFAFEYSLTDFIELLKRFINTNFSSIIGRDISELTEINDSTQNYLLETLAKKYRKTEQFFRPLTKLPEQFDINGKLYRKVSSAQQRGISFCTSLSAPITNPNFATNLIPLPFSGNFDFDNL